MVNINTELKGLDTVTVKIGDKEFQITNANGEMRITAVSLGEVITITPCCSNAILLNLKKM